MVRFIVKTKQKTQLKWHQNWSTIRLQKSPGENESTTSHVRQYNIYNIDQDKNKQKKTMKKHSNQDWKKNTDSTKSNCQVSNFSLEAFGTACFLNCESLHNLVVVFQDILHRKFDFLFIWKLKAKCSRVSQADLSPLSLCMGEGRFVAHFTFWILICIVHFFLVFAFQISNFAFAICIFSILHSVLCILYFAFCICIPTSWHFHHSAVWLLNDLHNLIQTSIIKRLEIYCSIYQNSSECFR